MFPKIILFEIYVIFIYKKIYKILINNSTNIDITILELWFFFSHIFNDVVKYSNTNCAQL